MNEKPFAERIQERFPEGLTGIFAIGGTRTTYILSEQRNFEDPGNIADFAAQGAWLEERYKAFIDMYLAAGGRNMIIGALSFRSFFERGEKYAALASREVLRLTGDSFCAFYRDRNIDPYFGGLEVLAEMPSGSAGRNVAEQIEEFRNNWHYDPSHRIVIWEIAALPLNAVQKAASQLDSGGFVQPDLFQRAVALHRYFSKLFYRVELPYPQFYLGTARNGDLKLRVTSAITLSGGEYLRMFYTPYPTLFTTPETLKVILEDLAFGKRLNSVTTDYSRRYTPELAAKEYARVLDLAARPETTLGLSRYAEQDD